MDIHLCPLLCPWRHPYVFSYTVELHFFTTKAQGWVYPPLGRTCWSLRAWGHLPPTVVVAAWGGLPPLLACQKGLKGGPPFRRLSFGGGFPPPTYCTS